MRIVCKVVITNITDDTFYAVIWLERDGTLVLEDQTTRPTALKAFQLKNYCTDSGTKTVTKLPV